MILNEGHLRELQKPMGAQQVLQRARGGLRLAHGRTQGQVVEEGHKCVQSWCCKVPMLSKTLRSLAEGYRGPNQMQQPGYRAKREVGLQLKDR